MPTEAHIESRKYLGYLMQHLEDAPGYSVWLEAHGGWYESNMAFLREIQNWLELTPKEMWLSNLSVFTTLENHLKWLDDIDIGDTSQVTRVEVIDQDGRQYTNYNCFTVTPCLQDHRKTLKIFLTSLINDNQILKSE